MAQTTWIPRTEFEEPKKWLLTNGEVVTAPPLEQTTSGRKVRVAGTDITAYVKDMDNLILDSVMQLAQQKQTSVWMSITDQKGALERFSGTTFENKPPALYVLDSTTNRPETVVWWRFRHATLPIEAYLTVRATVRTSWTGNRERMHDVATSLTAPFTHVAHAANINWLHHPQVCSYTDGVFSGQTSACNEPRVYEFVRDNVPPDWDPRTLLGSLNPTTDRNGVEALLSKIRECDELERIQIPDLRDPQNPEWLTLELYETNLTPSLYADLTEYLDSESTVQQATRIYNELRNCLTAAGIVLDDLNDNDFAQALLNTNPNGLTVGVGLPHEVNGYDHNHELRLHLLSGTFVVTCSLMAGDRNQIAEKWEEARTIASLSGEEDVLLAYAREVSRKASDERAKQIISKRSRK